jgi:U32 family peptidase
LRKIELLSPAGGMDKLITAYKFGADAVYLGGKAFNLRSRSSNFSMDGLSEATQYAKSIGKKVYITLNILAHDREIKALPGFIKHLEQAGADAVIVADLGVLDLVQEHSNLPIHISTQASTTNWRAVKMYQKLGAKRVVLAREVSISEIKNIKDKVPEMEIEVFVHGSMCMTYSGRCNLSSYFAERDGNRGACANTCRWKYSVVEERRPGEYFPVYEDETGTYMYNSKDLCTIEFLDQLLDSGVDGLKIEGRMKSLLYLATTTKVYREGLDLYKQGKFEMQPQWLDELKSYSHRGYTSGFFLGKLDKNSENLQGGYQAQAKFIGFVTKLNEDGSCTLEVKEKFLAGSDMEIVQSHGPAIKTKIDAIYHDVTGENLEVAQPNMIVRLRLPFDLAPYDVFRQRVVGTEPVEENALPFTEPAGSSAEIWG